MGIAMVSVQFEAKSAADVEEMVRTWKLHGECMISMSYNENLEPLNANGDGTVVEPQPLEPPPLVSNG